MVFTSKNNFLGCTFASEIILADIFDRKLCTDRKIPKSFRDYPKYLDKSKKFIKNYSQNCNQIAYHKL